MQALLRDIEDFASSNLPVLIRGESGTRKELVAGAIKGLSRRCGRGYRTINCADITPELLRSELFGHERGASTGAVGIKEGAPPPGWTAARSSSTRSVSCRPGPR